MTTDNIRFSSLLDNAVSNPGIISEKSSQKIFSTADKILKAGKPQQ